MDEQRNQFEAWLESRLGCDEVDLSKDDDGVYNSHATGNYYVVWIAAQEAAKPKWISVDDELPKIGDLIFCSDGLEVWKDEVSDYWIACAKGEEVDSCVDVVTKWMPMPKP